MLIIIPIKPNILPPIKTATNAQRAGRPTEPPTILGYVKLSSNCCTTKNEITYHIAFTGFETATKTAPITKVIKAPTYGIRAVIANKNPSIKAYGILSKLSITKNSKPVKKASKH